MNMPARQKLLQAVSPIEGYASAVLAVVCALAIRLVLHPMLAERAPFMFFFLTIVVVKRIWGRRPALLATGLGGISAWYFLIEPRFSFAIASRIDALNLVAYFAVGIGISFLGVESPTSTPAGVPVRKNIKLRVVRQTAVLASAALVLAGMVLLLHRDFKRTQQAESWVVHTYQVINSAESMLSTLGDADTGARSFLLSGDRSYLAPCKEAMKLLPRGLNELKALTLDNPGQQARWLEISRLTAQRLAQLNLVIESHPGSETGAAANFTRFEPIPPSTDELRSSLDDFMKEERRLLVERTSDVQNQAASGRWVLGLGSGGLILLLVLASVVIERETIRREKITEALNRHSHLLEQAHDSLLTFRLGGVIDYWNRGSETLYGYTREEAVGRFSHELLQTHHPLGMPLIDAILERDGQWKGELTQTTRSGQKLTVEGLWTLVKDADGSKTVLEANRDITERKRAESENLLLATAIEQAEETVVVTDKAARIQYANPAFSRTTGYSRTEAIGQNPRVLKSGEHDSKFYQGLWAALTTGKLWRGEFTNRRKDGTLYIEEATIAPVRDATGEITNYIAIKSDITERKRNELALRESEGMLRLFVRHAPASVAMFDREMRYLIVSKRWMTDYHLEDRDIRGRSHYEIFPEVPERWKEIHQRCLAGAVETCNEDPFLRADGSLDWLSWEVRPWRKVDGSIGGIIVFSELITERKMAEASLQESELRYRQLFERSESAQGLYEMVFDAQGNPRDYRYINVNPSWERLTGRNSKEFLGQTALEFTPNLEEYWIKLFGRVAATCEPTSFEHFARHLGRYYSGTAYSPRPNYVAVSFTDVTERKNAEETLRLLNVELEDRVRSRTAELESANRELEAFAHSVSHDLRAPLRGIDGWSLALLEDCGEQLNAQGRKHLDRVRSEAQRMGRLIDDLLHLSRVSRAELLPGTVDLTALAESIVGRLKEANPGRSLEFVVAPNLKCTGDARLLEIALTNLFDNAAKFTGKCPVARVEFGRADLQGNRALFVRDNGVGFDMAHAKLLFAPFQRLHKASEFPGTGIGLATVQRVIHRHGGCVWAEAQVGAGATFYFTLGSDK